MRFKEATFKREWCKRNVEIHRPVDYLAINTSTAIHALRIRTSFTSVETHLFNALFVYVKVFHMPALIVNFMLHQLDT